MGRRHHEGPPARRPKRSAAARGRCRSTATAGKSDASLSRAGPDTAPAGRRGGPGRASSAGSADQPRGGSRVARAGHRRASSSGRRDRSAGTGQTAVDRPPGRRSPSGASPPVLAGTPRGAGHPRRSVRVMENLGIELNRVLRGLARVVRRGRALRTLTLSAPWWDPVYPISAGRGNRLPSALAVGCSDLRPFQWSTTSPGLHAQPHSEGPRAPDPAFPRCLPSLAPPSVRRRRL